MPVVVAATPNMLNVWTLCNISLLMLTVVIIITVCFEKLVHMVFLTSQYHHGKVTCIFYLLLAYTKQCNE